MCLGNLPGLDVWIIAEIPHAVNALVDTFPRGGRMVWPENILKHPKTSEMVVPPVLQNARLAAQQSGLSYRQIGVRMGYPPASARQVVWNFLNRPNTSVAKLKRFAEAVGVEAGSLL